MEGRLAMNRADHVHAWFSDNREWVWFIIATVVLWLLMTVAISGLGLRTVG
jgi:nitrate reductase NapE component